MIKKIALKFSEKSRKNRIKIFKKNFLLTRKTKILDFGSSDGLHINEIVKNTKINKFIKDSKLKVQSQIQDEQIRVTAKKIDDLQKIISLLKEEKMDLPLQFVNMKK